METISSLLHFSARSLYHLQKSHCPRLNSNSVLMSFFPVSCSTPVRPCHLFLFLYASLAIGSRIFAPGHRPPAASPKASVPTYPAGWWCTAGWQSEPLYWDPQRTGRPRLDTRGFCRGVGMGTPAASGCWFRWVTAPLHPRPRWVIRTVPGWGGWNVGA